MEKTKVILDVDTGSDDAIAIILALLSEELDVLAITTVNGNQPVENTTENTLRVVDLLESKVPVYRGCSEPMVAELLPERHGILQPTQKTIVDGEVIQYHSEYLKLPPSVSKIQEDSAVTYLINTLMKSDGDIVLIPVGPLDATHAGCVTYDESKKMRSIGSKAAIAVADLLDERIKAYDLLQPMEIVGSTPPHDALAVCAVIDPTVLKDVRFMRVDVDFSGGICDGMTVLDQRVLNERPKNVHIALDCDREKFVSMMFNYLNNNR